MTTTTGTEEGHGMGTFTITERTEDGFVVTCDGCGASYFADKMADVIYIEDDGCDYCEPTFSEARYGDAAPLTATLGELAGGLR
jgi:hypothetical protein